MLTVSGMAARLVLSPIVRVMLPMVPYWDAEKTPPGRSGGRFAFVLFSAGRRWRGRGCGCRAAGVLGVVAGGEGEGGGDGGVHPGCDDVGDGAPEDVPAERPQEQPGGSAGGGAGLHLGLDGHEIAFLILVARNRTARCTYLLAPLVLAPRLPASRRRL